MANLLGKQTMLTALITTASLFLTPVHAAPLLKATVAVNEYKTGERFKAPAQKQDFWIPIPAWLAGTWQETTGTVHMLGMTRTITEKASTTFGAEVDQDGRIWHRVELGKSQVTQGSDETTFQIDDSVDVTRDDDQQVVVRLHGQAVDVSNATGRITAVRRFDEINTYRQAAPNAIEVDAVISTKVGFVPIRGKNESVAVKTAPFRTDPTLVESFAKR